MTLAEFYQAVKDKKKVWYHGKTGFVVDSYLDNLGQMIAVVAKTPSAVTFGNNVPISHLMDAEKVEG